MGLAIRLKSVRKADCRATVFPLHMLRYTYIHVYIYIHTYIYVFKYVFMYAHTHIYIICINTNIYMYINTPVCVCIHICMYTPALVRLSVLVSYSHTCVHICVYDYTFVFVHACTLLRKCVYLYIHTSTSAFGVWKE